MFSVFRFFLYFIGLYVHVSYGFPAVVKVHNALSLLSDWCCGDTPSRKMGEWMWVLLLRHSIPCLEFGRIACCERALFYLLFLLFTVNRTRNALSDTCSFTILLNRCGALLTRQCVCNGNGGVNINWFRCAHHSIGWLLVFSYTPKYDSFVRMMCDVRVFVLAFNKCSLVLSLREMSLQKILFIFVSV